MIVIALSASTDAATITISASKDATLFENNVNNSNGAGPGLFAGTNGMNSPRRGLIDFGVAGSVPMGATITDVQLTLHLGQVAGNDQTPRMIGLFRLTADWGEGTTGAGSTIGGTGQGFPANAGDATWNARSFPGILWATPGGDHAATASATLAVSSTINAPYTWQSTSDLVNDVQGWLDTPTSNFGWELINLDETVPTDFRAFYTREFNDAALRPQLQITFDSTTTVPEPVSIVLLPLGLLGLAGALKLAYRFR